VKLQKRERNAVYVLVAVAAVVLMYRLFLRESVDDMLYLRENVPQKRSTLADVRRMSRVYLRKQGEADALSKRIDARGSGFDPFVFLKGVAEAAGLKDRHTISLQNYRYEKNSRFLPKGWNIELSGVSQTEIGQFLHRLYSADKLLLVTEFNITPERKTEGLHAEIKVVTLFTR